MNKKFISFLKGIFKRKYLQPQSLVLNNRHFYLPRFSTGEFFNQKMSELWMIDLLKNYLFLDSGVFIDVGANVGQTLLKVRAVTSMEYLGFEPNPDCVSYLHQLIKINEFREASIIPVGISNSNALVELNMYSGPLDSSASMIDGFSHRPVKEKMLVPVLNLETIAKQYDLSFVSIIKIDVEGSELEVMKSFKNIILREHPFILLEVLAPGNNLKKKNRQRELEQMIIKLNYDIYLINKTNESVRNLVQVKKFHSGDQFTETDFLLFPPTGKLLKKDIVQ
ncbi:methyltransferase, FkbM family [Salinimicrobium catena]|uniref:Methyltransferase, FkbM family n=1 Tax=Salinimicrobium catena TaxID=390640 RepID=A0A1H5NAS8_9FLAO|nr:FkbM family methyltransferase [Salinimicrobium catena]SDL41277.1 methyltransferase, FkbM family [Salinimicrobium catena]SEE98624.1 methyltransferase, FkbM family [Salinimicrobium catena]